MKFLISFWGKEVNSDQYRKLIEKIEVFKKIDISFIDFSDFS